jgi:urease accessory protein
MRVRLLLVPLLILAVARAALAHPGHGGHDLASGFAHPFSGLDHVLAMTAVGLLAVRIGGIALWAMPATFVGSMTLGWLAGALGVPLPGVEFGIVASVLVLGVMLAATGTARLAKAMLLVGLFAVFHGHAHATEMVADGSPGGYAVGFVLATVILHASGVIGGSLVSRWRPAALRLAGAGIGAAGAVMLFGFV